MFVRVTILLIFAHMLTDYLLQWQGLVAKKKSGHSGAYLFHGFCFFLLAGIFTLPWGSPLSIAGIGSLSLVHLFQDIGKVMWHKKKPEWCFQLELADLILHLLFILLVAKWFFTRMSSFTLPPGVERFLSGQSFLHIALYGGALIFVTGGGTVLVRSLLTQIGKTPPRQSKEIGFISSHAPGSEEERAEKEYNVGRVIGNLERFLLLLFVIMGNLAAVGFVIAAKSVARFKDLEDHAFAEYYLVGTLSSSLIAILTGLGVRLALKILK